MSRIREYAGLLGVVATLAGGDWDSDSNPRANCTNAGVGWAAGAECGRSAAIVTEPFTQRGIDTAERKGVVRRDVVPTARDMRAEVERTDSKERDSEKDMTSLPALVARSLDGYDDSVHQTDAKAVMVPKCAETRQERPGICALICGLQD